MTRPKKERNAPAGGLQTPSSLRRWRWERGAPLTSAPVRCKKEQWYLVRGTLGKGCEAQATQVVLQFARDEQVFAERCLTLAPIAEPQRDPHVLGWVLSPEDATHLQVQLPGPEAARRLGGLVLHPIAERDPKCHPHANPPRWSSYASSADIERVVLPESLAALRSILSNVQVEVARTPAALSGFVFDRPGTACIIDPEWVRAGALRITELERLAVRAWVMVDLGSLAQMLSSAGCAKVSVTTHTAQHEIMSARVEYADLPTRGFGLQDVFPYATVTSDLTFSTRVLHANRAWKRYAGQVGFATYLASETPWENRCGDVLSAGRPIGQGELIATDLPWLAAGLRGRLLAPHLVRHLLRMHLGQPLDDWVQYWNRWEDGQIVVRDIVDLARRYAPLRTARWAGAPRGIASLGLALPAAENEARRLLIRTGRIDALDAHDGLAPEPMMILMRLLARESCERTVWSQRYLAQTTVTWQFETADGLRYAALYDAADEPSASVEQTVLTLRSSAASSTKVPPSRNGPGLIVIPAAAGVFGDGSLTYQRDLTGHVQRALARLVGEEPIDAAIA